MTLPESPEPPAALIAHRDAVWQELGPDERARTLVGAVHELADSDPDSAGTSLSTEHPPNVPLYQHFGYRVMGHAQVDRGLTTWVLFRERSPS